MDKKKPAPPATFDRVRDSVLMEELKARHWKSQYEAAYYYLKFKEIQPSYEEQVKKDDAEYQERLQRFQEEMAKEVEKEFPKEEVVNQE